MGLLSFFISKHPKVGDEFFGVLQFSTTRKDSAEGYFEGQCIFQPSGELIAISLDGSLATGPTERQKDFFRSIELNYASFIPRWTTIIEQEFGAWLPLPLVRDFNKEFKPGYLSIPGCEQPLVEWEIVFDTNTRPEPHGNYRNA